MEFLKFSTPGGSSGDMTVLSFSDQGGLTMTLVTVTFVVKMTIVNSFLTSALHRRIGYK